MESNKSLDKDNIPEHIAIIMDGNGRWAKEQGKHRLFGHKSGVTAVKSAVEGAAELGVKNLTLYAFSTENWNRPKREINALMQLLVNSINNETKTLNKNGIRLMAIGELSSLPSSCLNSLNKAIEQTKNNTHMNLILALSYSSRWELVTAVKQMVKEALEGKFKLEEIYEDLIQSYLTTANLPNPELLIRTSGEMRISNFLLWQIAYSELYFTQKNWPDFRKEDLVEAILNYQSRERRFGKTSDQLQNNA
jgi:undecaprenyl diphosphate synthase